MALQLNILSGLRLGPDARQDADWNAIYAEYLPRIYNFVRYRVEDNQVAEDLTSAAFERAWRSRASYRHDLAAFNTWLFTIARNLVTDHYRTRKVNVSLEDTVISTQPRVVEDEVERNEEFRRLHVALWTLGERERDLLALKYGAGCNNREISRIMKLGESNVGTIAQRAVARLRAQLDAGELEKPKGENQHG